MAQLRDRLFEDMKTAMREKAAEHLSTIRMIRAEILTKDKEAGNETSEEEILKILQSMVKRREEAAEQFERARRLSPGSTAAVANRLATMLCREGVSGDEILAAQIQSMFLSRPLQELISQKSN